MADLAFISPNPKFMALNSDGNPYAGGKLYTYKTGTTTPKITWKDTTKGAANTNPVILDSKGQADIWIDSTDGAYRFKFTDVDDVVLWTKDNIIAGECTIGTQLREAYAVASGTDIYTVTMPITLSVYSVGDHYLITFSNANTSTTPTLEIDSLGAKTIKNKGGGALVAGDINNDHPSILKYDGTDLILLNPMYASKITAAANITDEALVLGDGGVKGIKALALGAANLKLFMNAAGNANEYASGIKIGSFQRDMTIASGTQAISGIGFKPSHVIFIANEGAREEKSWGFDDGTSALGLYWDASGATYYIITNNTRSIHMDEAADKTYIGKITTLGADGFTITWTRAGVKTGTADIIYMAFR